MRLRASAWAAALALLPLPTVAGAAEIGRIRIHLVYEETGRLSEDISRWPELGAWNTYGGGGPAEENANDLVVLVEVIAAAREPDEVPGVVGGQLEIRATGDNGRLIGRRRFRESLLTGEDGRVWKALWLPDASCAGRIRIDATIDRSTRSAQVNLPCGE